MGSPIVLSYGLGVDSTAILLRWIHEPSCRDFALEDLVVVTAMTGDEWPETGQMVTDAILPLLREHGIRYVQVARTTGSQTDGITVLDDSRSPERLHLDGAFKLSDELLAAGTVPQMGGVRKCSQKAKGWPLDTVIERVLGKGVAFRHVVGFEAGEPNRAVKDAAANTALRTGEYPLIEWGWDRMTCEHYILAHTGIAWWKSACVYCPFALSNKAGRIRVLGQYRENVRAAVDAMFVEYVSLALNPKQGLNGEVRLLDLLALDGNTAAIEGLRERLDRELHAVYEVRRIVRPKKDDPTKMANASRSVTRLTQEMSRRDAQSALIDMAGELEHDEWFLRRWVQRRGEVLPAVERMVVVAPAVVLDKTDPKFEGWWAQALVTA